MSLNESIVEDNAHEWFGELGYAVVHGPQMAPGEAAAERDSFGEVVLVRRLRDAIRRLNQAIPEDTREEALLKVVRVATPWLVETNRVFQKLLRDPAGSGHRTRLSAKMSVAAVQFRMGATT